MAQPRSPQAAPALMGDLESMSVDEPRDLTTNKADSSSTAAEAGDLDNVDEGPGPSAPKRVCRGPRGPPCSTRKPRPRSPSPQDDPVVEDWSDWVSPLNKEISFSSLDSNRWITRSWHR